MPPRSDRRDFTDAFVVLLKRDVPELPALRGHIDDIVTGDRHYFSSIDGLMTFFRSVADGSPALDVKDEH